jgi:hypothetical protein
LNIIKLNNAYLNGSDISFWLSIHNSKLSKLDYVSRHAFPLLNENLLEYLKKIFFAEWKNIISDSSYTEAVDIYLSLYEYDYIECYNEFIECLMEGCDSFDKLLEINRLKDINIERFEKITKTEISIIKINEVADYEYRNADSDTAKYTRDNMYDISEYYGVDLDEYISELDDMIEENKRHEEQVEVHKINKTDDTIADQTKEIDKLFDTLLYK